MNSDAITTSKAVVHVVDDDPAVSQAISIVGKSLGYRVAAYASAEDFLYGYEPTAPGCVILDIKMPGMTGLELQKMLRDAGIMLPVIMISGHADVEMAVESMRQGAVDFLQKPFRMNVLKERIAQAIQIDEDSRIARHKSTEAKRKLALLTEKETQVLEFVVDGMTNKEIAEQLRLTTRAIEDRRARMMRKLELDSVVELYDLVRLAGDDQVSSGHV